MRYHADERRRFWGDIFRCPLGDINVVRPAKGVFIGWHRHQRQDDRLFLIQGVLRLRVFETHPVVDGKEWILVDFENDPFVHWIPRNRWHGYEALADDTILLQFNGPYKWDGTDEERATTEEFPWPITHYDMRNAHGLSERL